MELTLDQALQKGVEAHKAGKVQEADRYYTAILKVDPNHPDANHNMGVLAVGVGKVEEALPFFKAALKANSSMSQFWLSYINALIKLDRMTDAKAVFDQAKSKGATGDGFDELAERFRPLVQNNSNAQEPLQYQIQNLINLYNQGHYQETLTETLQLLKDFPNSINLYNIIGSVNQSLGKLDEAIDAYKKAIVLKSDYAEIHYNMGNALKEQRKLDEAINAYTKAVSIKPDYSKAYNNLGIVLKDQGKFEEAKEAYSKALSIKPGYADAFNNMGIVLKDQGKLEEAIQAYKKAISIMPNNIDINENFLELETQLRGTVFKQAKKNDQENIITSVLLGRPRYNIIQAICAFIKADKNLVYKHLKKFKNCDASLIEKLDHKDQVFCAAYHSFLTKLMDFPSDVEQAFPIENTIFHLGESHCLSYAHKQIKIQGIYYTLAPRIIFGAKMYHFSKKNDNAYKAITKANFDSLPDSSKVFLSFGEIDCRPDEGFIFAAKKHKKPIEDLVSDTVIGYVDWFVEQNQNKNHSLFFFNVPAPIYNKKYSAEVNGEVTRTIKLFNSLLHKTVLDHEFNIIDVYKFTAGKDEYSNGLFHIDNNHLSSHAIPEIEKQIGTLL